jgi:hypothetical protein
MAGINTSIEDYDHIGIEILPNYMCSYIYSKKMGLITLDFNTNVKPAHTILLQKNIENKGNLYNYFKNKSREQIFSINLDSVLHELYNNYCSKDFTVSIICKEISSSGGYIKRDEYQKAVKKIPEFFEKDLMFPYINTNISAILTNIKPYINTIISQS